MNLKIKKSFLTGFLLGIIYFIYSLVATHSTILISIVLLFIPVLITSITLFLISKKTKKVTKKMFIILLILSLIFYLALLPSRLNTEVTGFYIVLVPIFFVGFFVVPLTFMTYLIERFNKK